MRIATFLPPLLSLLVACLTSPVTGNPYETWPYAPVASPYGLYTQGTNTQRMAAVSPQYQPYVADVQAVSPQVIDGTGMLTPTPTPAPVHMAVTANPDTLPGSPAVRQAPQAADSYYRSYQNGVAAPQVHGGHAVGCADNGYGFNSGVNGHCGINGGCDAYGSVTDYGVAGSAPAYDTTTNHGTNGYADGYSSSVAGCDGYGANSQVGGLLSRMGNGRFHRGWYGSFGGLYMSRDRPNRLVLTTEDAYPYPNLMDNRDADTGWEGGFEVTFGRCISDRLRWELGFWYLNSFQGFSSVLDPGGQLITPLNLDNVFLDADPLAAFFDYSSGHEVYREDNFHNLELNFYYRLCCSSAGNCYGSSCGGCSGGYAGDYAAVNGAHGAGCGPAPQRWNIELLGGVRYFNFDEYFIFAGVQGGSNFGDWGGADEAYIISKVENQLVGFQLGTLVEYNLSCNWTLYARPKVGIYGNRSNVWFNVTRGDGAFTGWNGYEDYPVHGTKNDVALLAELDLGVRWNFGCHWSAYAGYRVVGATGVALSDNQIPFYLADVQAAGNVDTNGSLILHGAMFGLGFQY